MWMWVPICGSKWGLWWLLHRATCTSGVQIETVKAAVCPQQPWTHFCVWWHRRLILSFQWPFMHGAAHAMFIFLGINPKTASQTCTSEHAMFICRSIYTRWQTSFSVSGTPSFLCTGSIGLDPQDALWLVIIIWLSTQRMHTWTHRLLSSLTVLWIC